MRKTIGVWPVLLLALAVPSTAFAFDESGGDFSSLGTAPTALSFVRGVNVVSGTVNGTGDVRDWITFTVPAGQQLVGIRLVSWAGNRGYTALKTGTSGPDPSGANTAQFLGGDHTDEGDDGIQLFTSLQDGKTKDGSTSGTGFTPPLAAGSYTYLVQQTSPGQANPYALEFIIGGPAVPAFDGTWVAALTVALLAVGALLLRARSQRTA